MSQREVRHGRTDRKSTERRSSVVGSTLHEISSQVRGRALPRGGIREHDGLKVADGAIPDSTIMHMGDGKDAGRSILRIVAIVSGSLLLLLLIAALTLTILSHSSIFTITSIVTTDSAHMTADDIARLIELKEGATLLNLDESAIEKSVKRNPWVASVSVRRIVPDKLQVSVQERSLGAVVSMGSGGIAWLLGDDGYWIEPTRIETGERESFNEAALKRAQELGVMLISDVPATVTPVAGTPTTDSSIAAVSSFREQLSPGFLERVVSFVAPSEDDISCVMSNGVEVSLGSPTNVATKESVAERILSEFEGQITYINVRAPSHPTYRRVNSTYVREGTGATGSAVDTTTFGQPVAKVTAEGDSSGIGQDENQSVTGSEDATSGNESATGSTVSSEVSGLDDNASAQGYDTYGSDTYSYDAYDSYGNNGAGNNDSYAGYDL